MMQRALEPRRIHTLKHEARVQPIRVSVAILNHEPLILVAGIWASLSRNSIFRCPV
jgi:hypothetical protein